MGYMNQAALTAFARAQLGPVALAGGDVFFVDPATGKAGNDGLTPQTAVATITQGYALTTDGRHDIVCYIGGPTSLTESAITWAKSYTHLVGVCAEVSVAQRARIFLTPASTSTVFLTISGSGCGFANFYIFHGVASTSSLICAKVTGQRNHFRNVHFAGIGHATGQGDVAGARSLWVTGSECKFVDCTIGVDTIARSTTNAEIEFSGAATRNEFRDCLFLSYADNAGHLFLKAASSADIDRWVLFRDCIFSNAVKSAATVMTQAFSVHASVGGYFLLKNCTGVGFTDYETTPSGNVLIDGGPPTAATSGLAVAVA